MVRLTVSTYWNVALVSCADALRVIVYQGQSQTAGIGGRQSVGPVTPRDLAAVDVCITTYDVLRRDLNHRPDEGAVEHALRRRKKYEVQYRRCARASAMEPALAAAACMLGT